MTIRNWIKQQESLGKPTFSYRDVKVNFSDMPEQHIMNELYRLSRQKIIQSVYKSFYTVIPIQYSVRGIVPPTYYIDQLMEYLAKPYYISLLSAAEIHGAAHQRPQRFSVTTLRPVVTTSARKNNLIVWNYRKDIPENLLCSKNSETGIIHYSSAELTAVDLVQFEHQIGGLSVAATVLSELVETIDFSKNSNTLFQTASLTSIQRLGYILDYILEETKQAEMLYQQLCLLNKKPGYTPLAHCLPIRGDKRNNKWKIIINQTIEIDDI
ncbi:MAG: type IV toxin-antitoxin system AbiEi family antitoxin domain-containing protein [Butyricimonas faecihominis]